MFKLRLGQKLFLVSLLLLLVPWLGIRYVKAIEDYLQHLMLDNLSSYTQSVATYLVSHHNKIPEFPPGDSIYASPLNQAPSLDGYDEDWGAYSSAPLVLGSEASSTRSPELNLGRYEDSIYLFLKVYDRHIQYWSGISSELNDKTTDGIILELASRGETRKLILLTEAPGTVFGRLLPSGQTEARVQGTWRERDEGMGYQVEFRLPASYVSQGINIRVRNANPDVLQDFQLRPKLAAVLSAPDALRQAVEQFSIMDGRRLWLLDRQGRILVNRGSLHLDRHIRPVNPLFAWLLTPDEIEDPWQGKTRFERDDVLEAINGKAESRRTRVADGSGLLLSSAWPIMANDEIYGVILIEESTAALQVLQRSALASMLNISLLIFVLLTIALIGFAGRLAGRIRRLKQQTDRAIDDYGRVNNLLPEPRQGDELDELSNHIRDMLVRLRAYHDYLEKLASRLSHEIRTPLAVVRSSLEHIQPEDAQTEHLHRAHQGIERLQTLLHRMAEASRLEQSIHESERKQLALAEFMSNLVAGYRAIYPRHQFSLEVELGDLYASPDLLSQALDKLVANATSFAPDGTTIVVEAIQHNGWRLSVTNQGPPLPDGMEQQLFQSMVSVRDKQHKDGQPHLGLGLYIVQLIAEFHQGSTNAENVPGGVRFSLSIN